ncbi:MAG: hypothetical protein ACREDR_44420, partial [Blastocatellia bacterium]
PTGVSQNLAPGAAPCLPNGGNQQGVVVTFTCAQGAPLCTVGPPVVGTCTLTRTGVGRFVLTVTGTGVLPGATLTISGQTPRKVTLSGQTFSVKGACKLLPGAIVITNPASAGQPSTCPTVSQPVQCTATCPAQ